MADASSSIKLKEVSQSSFAVPDLFQRCHLRRHTGCRKKQIVELKGAEYFKVV